MARSFDNRRFPSGPLYGPDGKLIMRGPRRKIVGRVTPGDDVEVSREIERLWEWHTRLAAENNRLHKYIEELIRLLNEFGLDGLDVLYQASVGVNLVAGKATFLSTTGAITLSPATDDGYTTLSVGPYRANYEAGWRLQATVVCALSDVDEMAFKVKKQNVAATIMGTAYSSSFVGGTGTSTGGVAIQMPWWTMTYDGSALNYAEELDIGMSFDTQLAISSGAVGDGTIWWRWMKEEDTDIDLSLPGDALPIPTDQSLQSALVWDPAQLGWVSSTDLDVNARVGGRVDGGTTYERRRINFISGTGMDLSAADDSVNEEIDVTITFDPTEIDVTALAGYGGAADEYLAHDGTWSQIISAARLNAVLYGTPALGTTRYLVVPRGPADADITIDLERLHLRTETPSGSGSVVAVLQKSTGGEAAPSWTDIGTATLTAGEYEVDFTIGAYTVTSDDLLRLYFTSIGTGCTDYQAIITGTEQ